MVLDWSHTLDLFIIIVKLNVKTVPNVTTTSDETKKRDIKELSDSDLIYKLRPVEYKWKDENMDQGTKYGFIAQEVLEIFPSIVTKQNGVYGIEYINLISHLVK